MIINRAKQVAFLGAAVLGLSFASQAQADLVLPPPDNGTTTLTYGDFDVYSLPFLNFLATGETNQLGDYEVQSTPGIIKDLVVIATGSGGTPVNENYEGMDNALQTPNMAMGDETFYTQPSNEPDQVAPFPTDNNGTWDAEIDALRTFLDGGELLIFFNLNENNQEGAVLDAAQDILVYAEVTLVDVDMVLPDMTFTLNGINPDPVLNTFTNFGTFDFGDGDVDDVAQVHGEICVNTATTSLIRLGPCEMGDGPDAATINQNLGADRAAFALTNSTLSDILNDMGTLYDVLRLDFRMGELSDGFEQLFLTTIERGVPVPEPGTLGMLGLGLAGLGIGLRRRRRS
ncbi:MAG: PEP-CTERM sorting domain-containing protein [Sphingomonadales bacterium]|jgi:hypothetical protein